MLHSSQVLPALVKLAFVANEAVEAPASQPGAPELVGLRGGWEGCGVRSLGPMFALAGGLLWLEPQWPSTLAPVAQAVAMVRYTEKAMFYATGIAVAGTEGLLRDISRSVLSTFSGALFACGALVRRYAGGDVV